MSQTAIVEENFCFLQPNNISSQSRQEQSKSKFKILRYETYKKLFIKNPL